MSGDRIAVAIVRCPLWRALFWLTRPINHIAMLQMCDALEYAPITWKHVFLMRDPRYPGKFTGEQCSVAGGQDA